MPANVSTNAMRVDFQARFQQYSVEKMTAIQQPSSLDNVASKSQQLKQLPAETTLGTTGFADIAGICR